MFWFFIPPKRVNHIKIWQIIEDMGSGLPWVCHVTLWTFTRADLGRVYVRPGAMSASMGQWEKRGSGTMCHLEPPGGFVASQRRWASMWGPTVAVSGKSVHFIRQIPWWFHLICPIILVNLCLPLVIQRGNRNSAMKVSSWEMLGTDWTLLNSMLVFPS